MATDPTVLLAFAATGLLGLCMAAAALLTGWQGWLELKRIELVAMPRREAAPFPAAARIEVADLKERVRKLEAIATGIDP